MSKSERYIQVFEELENRVVVVWKDNPEFDPTFIPPPKRFRGREVAGIKVEPGEPITSSRFISTFLEDFPRRENSSGIDYQGSCGDSLF